MTQYIGQITVILETETSELASETLSFLARQLDNTRPEVLFADHNGDVEDYEKIEQECEETLTTTAMTYIDSILTDIARQHLGISTMETRRSDSLDFHDVAVWKVKEALTAAYRAGAETCGQTMTADPELPARFDDYEIEPRIRHWEDGDPEKPDHSFCDEHEADIWRLYGHIIGRDSVCIGEYTTRTLAEEVYARITGCRYGTKACRNQTSPRILKALQMASNYLSDNLDESDKTEMRVFTAIRAAIAEATNVERNPL